MNGELENGPILWRADIDALQLVFGRDLAFDEFADLGIDLAHLLGDFAAEILVYLYYF